MQIYVSASVKRSGDGSQAAPFQTINEAAQVAVAGDEVIVLPGYYREWVDPQNGGESDACRITYRSQVPGGAVITGSEVVKTWEPYQGDVWVARIPNGLFGNYNPYTTLIEGDWYIPSKPFHTGEVYLNGRPVGDEIRTPVCSLYASDVSKLPEVRAFLLSLQRDIAAKHNVVMDGRDIGTVILPDADVKLFMSASDEERARRRWRELNDKGIRTTLSEVMTEMRSRDENDKNRAIAPAVPAPDALPLDNTGMTAAETVAAADRLIRDRLGDKLLQAEACL